MINKEFCELLEHKISKAFSNSRNDIIRQFWCDGIMPPTFENHYSKKFINDNRQVEMAAFIGLSGQDKYELILKFGDKALGKYARNLDITGCIPNPENTDWFDVDTERKILLIQLD